MTGKGLSAKYHFPRQPCLYQPTMVSVQVTLTNGSDHSLEKIHIGEGSPPSLHILCFNTIGEMLSAARYRSHFTWNNPRPVGSIRTDRRTAVVVCLLYDRRVS